MSANEVPTPLREVRWRVITCGAIICLALDSLNPVKIFTEMTGIDGFYVAVVAMVFFFNLLYANASELAYFGVKVLRFTLIKSSHLSP